MKWTSLAGLAAAAALLGAPAAFAVTGDGGAPSPSATAAPAAKAVPLTSLKPAQVPQRPDVVSVNGAAMGQLREIYVGTNGNVSQILVTPSGQDSGKLTPAEAVSVAGGKLILNMDRTAFAALPDRTALQLGN